VQQVHTGIPIEALHTGIGADRQREGGALAAEHLVALGHRRIARVSGPDDWLEAVARDAGVEGALDAAGVRAGPVWRGDWSASAGAGLASRAAAAVRAGVTAIVVANDQMALGLIAGLRAEGIDVPADVSVTGFDDNPDAAFYAPALTTVRLDLAGEARRAVAAVIGVAALEVEQPVLLARDSTARPR